MKPLLSFQEKDARRGKKARFRRGYGREDCLWKETLRLLDRNFWRLTHNDEFVLFCAGFRSCTFDTVPQGEGVVWKKIDE
jgi:hypothetical protein